MCKRFWFRSTLLCALTALPAWASLNVKSCAPAPATTPMQYQDLVNCAITEAGQSQLFSFSVKAGDAILIGLANLNNSAAQACFRIIPPSGTPGSPICAGLINYIPTYVSNVQSEPPNFTAAGAYTIQVIEGSGSRTFNYALYLVEKIPVPSSAVAVPYGTVMSGVITPLGDHDLFVFNGSSGDTVNITLSRTSGSNQKSCFSVISPDATRADTCAGLINYIPTYTTSAMADIKLSESGLYELQVWDAGDAATFPYNLEIQCFGVCPAVPATPARVVNDFAGDGRSGALIYDPKNGQSYTALSTGNGTYNYVGSLFSPGFDTLRTGDFNGDGKADLILYNSKTAAAYIGFGKGDGTFNFQSLFWSPGYDTVVTGDINGDGMTDVALYNSTNGTMYTGISNGDGTFTYKYTLISSGYTFVRLAGFVSGGKAGIILYRALDGLANLGIGDGTGAFAFNPLSISPGYNLADIGDLNDDGKADIILYNAASGRAATGISNGAGGFTFTPLVISPGFTSIRLADYTRAGFADVTVYSKDTAVAYFGTGTGTGNFNFQSLFWSPGYNNVDPEYVNGGSRADIILYDSATGTEYTGISNGDGTFSYTYQYWGIGKLL